MTVLQNSRISSRWVRAFLVAPLALSGCFEESAGEMAVDEGAEEEASGDAETGDTGDADATTDTETTAGDGDGDGDGAPECGNGVVEDGEGCDDGNADETDACTSACAAPACDDGIVSGDETDVDCGGSCEACEEGAACGVDADCGSTNCYVGVCVEVCEPWAQQLGTSDHEGAYGIAVDEDGYVYVAGDSFGDYEGDGNAGETDAIVVRLEPGGTVDFVRQTGGTAPDYAFGVAARDDVFAIVGRAEGPYDGNAGLGDNDGFVTIYDDNTTKLVSIPLGTALYDQLESVALDSNGKLLMVGNTNGAYADANDGSSDLLVLKLNQDGTEAWARQLGEDGVLDYGRGVAVDANNNLIAVGDSNGSFDGNAPVADRDAVIVKFDPDGAKQWSVQLGSSAADRVDGVTTDDAGDIYAVGTTFADFEGEASQGGEDAFLTKISSDGVVVWTRQFGTSADDGARDVAVDAEGTIYVAGWTLGDMDGAPNQGMHDMLVVAFDSAGEQLWSDQRGTDTADVGRGIAVGAAGEVYVVGYTAGVLADEAEGLSDGYAARVCAP